MTNGNIVAALQVLAPGAEWSLSGDGLAGLVWLDRIQPRPTDVAIQAEIVQLQQQPSPRDQAIAQARSVFKNSTLLPGDRLDALAKILGI